LCSEKNKVKSKIKKVKGRFEKLKNAKSTDKMLLLRAIYLPKISKESFVAAKKTVFWPIKRLVPWNLIR